MATLRGGLAKLWRRTSDYFIENMVLIHSENHLHPCLSCFALHSSSLGEDEKTAARLRFLVIEEDQLPSSSDYHLVEEIFFNLRLEKWDALQQIGHLLNPLLVVNVLYKCRDNAQLGFSFFDWAGQQQNYRHTAQSLSAMVHILVKSRRLADAQVLLLRMVRKSGILRTTAVDALVSTYKKCNSTPLVFDLLIRTYVQAKRMREATEAFHRIRSSSFLPSIHACNNLLGGLVKASWVDMAWRIYTEILQSKISVNVYTLNIMINALCKERKLQKAKNLLDGMELKGCSPDIVTYNTLIDAHCREGLLNEAFNFLNAMSEKGLMPDIVTYGALMNGHCREGKIEEASKLMKEMLEKGLEPNNSGIELRKEK